MKRAIAVRIVGPLAPHLEGFWDELARQHYTPLSAANQLRVMAHLSRWLRDRRIEPQHLGPPQIEEFLRTRRRAGYTCWLSVRGLSPMLDYLRAVGVVPQRPPDLPTTEDGMLVQEYVEYLRAERGLVETTIRYRKEVARDFLAVRQTTGDCCSVENLRAEDVVRFIAKRGGRFSSPSAGGLATAVRSLLRFLHVRGYISSPLTGAVPKMRGWRNSALPRGLEPDEVARLLGSCDRRTDVGRRDYAILILLARLGLRRCEVTRLTLDDIDWRCGEIIVRGKGADVERLPLPADVGDALAGYARRGRPPCVSRTLFVRTRAPHRPLEPSAVTMRVYEAAARAGLERFGAHRLRHAAAMHMLDRGASLEDIAQVLRHRAVASTAIYAKVDLDSLRSLAQPWPAGDR
jgi:integrase/recombinase XerD